MPARLVLLDAEGRRLGLAAGEALDFGEVAPGGASPSRRLTVRNDGDAPVSFARVRAVLHPRAQAGSAAHTLAGTAFALTEGGAYAPELELGALAPGEERACWARWEVRAGAPPGAAVWALEVVGA